MSYKVRNLIISGLIAHSDFFPSTLVWILEVYEFKAAYTLVTHHQVNIKTINKTEKMHKYRYAYKQEEEEEDYNIFYK